MADNQLSEMGSSCSFDSPDPVHTTVVTAQSNSSMWLTRPEKMSGVQPCFVQSLKLQNSFQKGMGAVSLFCSRTLF